MHEEKVPPEESPDVESLVCCLGVAKLAEDDAKRVRIEFEEQIAELISGPDSGQVTKKLADGTKVVVKRGFNYKATRADCDKIQAVFLREGFDTPPPIRIKTVKELDVKYYEYYRANLQNVYLQIAGFVSVTPKKVSVVVSQPKVD